MATGLENEQKELAAYIRAGSTRGPQCFGSYFDEKGGSCALGAVYEGVYHLPRDHGKLIPDHLERLFRCLDEVTKKCPQGCSKRLPLAAMIVHLNDDHRWTREQAGLFDVSHMGQAFLVGPNHEETAGALETLVPATPTPSAIPCSWSRTSWAV